MYINCSVVNDTTAIAFNFTAAAENDTRLFDFDFDGSFTYWGSQQSSNVTLTHTARVNETPLCISPKNATVYTDTTITYEKTFNTTWRLRYYTLKNFPTIGNSTNITLYLLPSNEGVYVTFQVINTAGQPLNDVLFTAQRTIGGTLTTIYSQLTDDAGSVVPFLNPDVSHTFTFIKSGYDTITTTIIPTQTLYTITMGEAIAIANETIPSRAITFNILPINATLNNNTVYNFTFNISSKYYKLDSAGFALKNSSGDILDTASCTGDTGCIASVNYNVADNDYIIMQYVWRIDGVLYQGGKRTWFVYATYEGKYSMMKIFEDAELLGAGFSDFTKAIISFLIIISILGVVTLKFSLHNYSEGAIILLIAFLTAALDFVGFLPNVNPTAIPFFIPIMIFIIGIGYLIWEFKR